MSIAAQIADGLAAAHEAGITHRDLKPENVMLTREGRAKIVDFGLAKPVVTARPDSDVTATPSTAPGIVVGTVPYMSPEQANGLPADYRADQFAFGCMLYEMVAGKRPFDRADAISTLSAILNDDPAPLEDPGSHLPAPLRWVIERCLAKDPARRFVSTADLHRQLCDIRDHVSEVVSAGGAAAPHPRRGTLSRGLAAVAALAAIVLAALFIADRGARPATLRYTPFATESRDELHPAWSPDGRTLAYVAAVDDVWQVFTRSLDGAVPAQITRSRANSSFPFWSADGNRIFYASDDAGDLVVDGDGVEQGQKGVLWAVRATGGAPERVIQGLGSVRLSPSAALSADGRTVAFFRLESSGLSTLHVGPVESTGPAALARPPFPEAVRFPHGIAFSPDSSKIAVGIVPDIGLTAGFQLWLVPIPSGTPRRLAPGLPNDVRPTGFSWMPDNRRLVLSMELHQGTGHHLYELDTSTHALRQMTGGAGEEQYPAVSPDGSRIAYASGGVDWDLAEMPVDGSRVSVMLATSRREWQHAWSPAGTQYVYVSNARGPAELWMRAEQDDSARLILTHGDDGSLIRASPRFAPDGQRITFGRIGPKHRVWIAHLAGGPAVPLEEETDDQHGGAWSPDGNWVAYCRFTGGRWQLARVPSGGGRPVPIIDGCDAEGHVDWSAAGDTIAYAGSDGLHAVSPDGNDHRRLTPTRPASFVFAHDGASILTLRSVPARGWALARVSASDGAELSITPLPLPPAGEVCCLSLHPDGERLGISIGTTKRDIWLLEGVSDRVNWFGRIFRR